MTIKTHLTSSDIYRKTIVVRGRFFKDMLVSKFVCFFKNVL